MNNNDYMSAFNVGKGLTDKQQNNNKEEEFYSSSANGTKSIKILVVLALVLFGTMLILPKQELNNSQMNESHSSLNIEKNLHSQKTAI